MSREDLGEDLGDNVVTGQIPAPAGTGSAIAPAPAAKPHFANVYVFEREFWAPVYARRGLTEQSQWHWCPRWWEHAEAVSRLDGLWHVFETLRTTLGVGPAS